MGDYTTEKKFVVAEGDAGELYIFLTAKKDARPVRRRLFMTGATTRCFCATANRKSFWIIFIRTFERN